MKKSNSLLIAIAIIVIAALGVGGWYYMTYVRNGGPVLKDSGSNISDYTAVFLTNGQVYFGKMDSVTDKEVTIKDIFYLQVNQALQSDTTAKATPSPSASPDIQLIKLGNELHGPNDFMHINRQQVLFTESLKDDSKVVKAISDYKAK